MQLCTPESQGFDDGIVVSGSSVGKVTQKVADLLISTDASAPNGAVFKVVHDPVGRPGSKILTLAESAGSTVDSRTDAIMSVMQHLQSRNIVTGWRDELYPCAGGFYDEPLFYVERAAAPFLGSRGSVFNNGKKST